MIIITGLERERKVDGSWAFSIMYDVYSKFSGTEDFTYEWFGRERHIFWGQLKEVCDF